MMLRVMFTALAILSSVIGSAHAALITGKINIDITRIFDPQFGDVFCEPCGPSSVTFYSDPVNSYSFDWWGSAGWAHDAYNQALIDGTDIYDEGADNPIDENDWIDAHPNSIVILNNEGNDGIFYTFVYGGGDPQDTLRDFIDIDYLANVGRWYTTSMQDEGLEAYFRVLPASPIPEPGTLAIFLFGVIGARIASRRNAGGQSSV